MSAIVPFADLRRRLERLAPELEAALRRVAASGRLLGGDEVAAFEAEWAAWLGRGHAVAVASGTDALTLGLRALGVGERPGDEVVVPAFTAMPTLAAVVAAGGRPVPVDVDPATAGMDERAAAAAITPRTRAIVPVHLYGRPCPLPDLGVPVLDDAAQAHGALAGSTRAAATAYSFYPTKNLGGIGDGGAVVTDDPALAARVRSLADMGRDSEGSFAAVAAPSRMSELEAAALRAALPGLRAANERRAAIARRYREAAPALAWAADDPAHVFHLCVARERDRLRGGDLPFRTGVHYPRAATQEHAYAGFTRTPCPHAEAWAATCVSLPCFPELTDAEVDLVAAALATA